MHLDRLILGGAVSAAPSRQRPALAIAADAVALVAVLTLLVTTAAIFDPNAGAVSETMYMEPVTSPQISEAFAWPPRPAEPANPL